MQTDMHQINITRPSYSWWDLSRSIPIYVDGIKLGSLKRGRHLSVGHNGSEVSIMAKIDWCHSAELSVNAPGRFSIKHYRLSGFVVVSAIGILCSHFIAKYLYGDSELLWFIFIPGIIHLYYLTIGCGKYLRVVKE